MKRVVLAAAVAMLAAGCSATDPDMRASSQPAAVAPVAGECWDYPKIDYWDLSRNPLAKKVDCAEKHTAETVWVGTVPADLAENPAVALEERTKTLTMAKTREETERLREANPLPKWLQGVFAQCDNAIIEKTGAPGRLMGDVTFPSVDEWDAGARWMRCNAVAEKPIPDWLRMEYNTLDHLPVSIDRVMSTSGWQRWAECFYYNEAREGFDRAYCDELTSSNPMWMTRLVERAGPSVLNAETDAQRQAAAMKFCKSRIGGEWPVYVWASNAPDETGEPALFVGCAAPSHFPPLNLTAAR